MISEVEYKFPYKQDDALLAILGSILKSVRPMILGNDLNVGNQVTEWIVKKIWQRDLNPKKYMVKAKTVSGGSASVDALASAKLGKNDKKTEGRSSGKWFGRKPGDIKDIKSIPFLSSLLSISASANIHHGNLIGVGNGCAGKGQRNQRD